MNLDTSQPLFKGIKFTIIVFFSYNINRSPSILRSPRVPEAKQLKKDQSSPKSTQIWELHICCSFDLW